MMSDEIEEAAADPSETDGPASPDQPVLNRADRRALERGKKNGGGNTALPNVAGRSGAAQRATGPAHQGRLQTRGSNRGK